MQFHVFPEIIVKTQTRHMFLDADSGWTLGPPKSPLESQLSAKHTLR